MLPANVPSKDYCVLLRSDTAHGRALVGKRYLAGPLLTSRRSEIDYINLRAPQHAIESRRMF